MSSSSRGSDRGSDRGSRVGWQAGRPRQSRVDTEFGPMPPRMAQIFYECLKGENNSVLAARMGLSLKGVKHHITNIYALANVGTRAELIAKWHKIRNMVPSPSVLVTAEVPELPRGGYAEGRLESDLDKEFEGDC